jgi:hypothetical protein
MRPIPQHYRQDERWCQWSGCTTVHPDGLCPDRCQLQQRHSCSLCGGATGDAGHAVTEPDGEVTCLSCVQAFGLTARIVRAVS